jgi:hypothetical protein
MKKGVADDPFPSRPAPTTVLYYSATPGGFRLSRLFHVGHQGSILGS